MAFSKFINPKKKRRVNVSKDLPFPVPVAEREEAGSWFYYTGYLHDNHVEIKHSGDIDRLYKMGFFGKGTLSRSKPEFNQRFRTVDIPNRKGEIITARVTSRRNYMRRLQWSHGKYRGMDCDDDMDFYEDEELSEIQEITDDKAAQPPGLVEIEHTPFLFKIPEVDGSANTGNEIESWEEDAEFWGMDTDCISTDKRKKQNSEDSKILTKGDNSEPDKLLSGSEDQSGIDSLVSKQSGKTENGSKETSNCLKHTSFSSGDHLDQQHMLANTCSQSEYEDKNKIIKGCDSKESLTNQSKGQNIEQLIQYDKIICNYDESATLNSDLVKCGHGIDKDKLLNSRTLLHATESINTTSLEMKKDLKLTNNSCVQNDQVNIQSENDKTVENCDVSSLSRSNQDDSDLDSLCRSDDEDGTLFVVNDSDSEPEHIKRKRGTRRKRKKWQPVLKRDPFYVQENLHLSFEEAFFLSYGLGCLVLIDQNKEKPDLTKLWQHFHQRQKNFIPNYIAYHYYRSKGWVPKTGLKFGSDLLIYKEGPAFYHGSYSVLVTMVMEETMTKDTVFPGRDLDWTSLAGLNRLTEQVAKEVLLCHVIRPCDMTDEDMKSPKCIPRFKIQEVLLSRWVSSQEREKQSTDIP